MTSSLETLRRYVARTIRPTSHPAFDVIGALSSVGLPFALVWSSWRLAVIAGLLVVAALMAWSGFSLQREIDRYNNPRFSLRAEPVDHLSGKAPMQLKGDATRWWDGVALWISIDNAGPTARFAARITNVTGVRILAPGQENEKYQGVPEVAWEHTFERQYEVYQGQSARLKVAWYGRYQSGSETGKVLWFWTARSESWAKNSHGAGLRLAPTARQVSFDLVIKNLDAQVADVVERFVIELDDAEDVVGLSRLSDVA